MDIKTRKLNFIQEVLALNNAQTMEKLERVLQEEKKQERKESTFHDLLGVISEEEATEMEKEIEASCEQINEDDWK